MLLDGWSLAYAPGSSPALHLQELLALLPDDVDALIAAPAAVYTPPGLESRVLVLPQRSGYGRRLAWEQVVLPRLARQQRASFIHLTSPYAPVFSTVKTLVSPAEWFPQGGSFSKAGQRLRAAFGRGGLANSLVLWADDLPAPALSGAALHRLPPAVHPAFFAGDTGSAAEGWMSDPVVFAPGRVDESHLPELLAAWSWAAAGLGEDWMLVVAGDEKRIQPQLDRMREQLGIKTPVHAAACFTPEETAQAIHGAAAVMVLGQPSPWGDPLLQCLSAGKGPAVLSPEDAAQRRWVEARVGPAAYLASDLRTLGAAVLTLATEEAVNEPLKEAARARAASWGSEQFRVELEKIYRRITRT